MSSEKKILVVGGGVIGLCCGYFLAKAGHRVEIVDRDATRRESCSDRNAGMVVPSHFIPLAAPGVISQGLKWMLNPHSPFYLRPRADLALLRWCWQFFRHSNRRHVENSKMLLRDLSLESRTLFAELANELGFTLVEKGLLMLCQTEAALEEETEVAGAANEIGIQAEICSLKRLQELDPDIEMNALGGVWFPRDAHLDSIEFLDALRKGILANGGTLREGEVTGFAIENGKIQNAFLEGGDDIAADQTVIAGGAWTPSLAALLGLHVQMQSGKGYSFTLKDPTQLPSLCSILKEGRIAVTPMGETLRVAGTLEICGNDLSIDYRRLEGIVKSFCQFLPAFSPDDFSGLEPWSGLRPCSPDGLPYIGDVPGCENAIVATGHAMLGLSLGPVTGRLVADICGEKTTVDRRLAPDRFH